MEGEGDSEFRRKRTRTSMLLFCISIFFGQWGWFYSITAEHYLLYFDKMKPSPWDFFTHCSLGYFTAVLFHYLLIFQHAVCIAVIYTSSDSPQQFLTPQGEIMEFTWDTKGRQQVLQKRRQIANLIVKEEIWAARRVSNPKLSRYFSQPNWIRANLYPRNYSHVQLIRDCKVYG